MTERLALFPLGTVLFPGLVLPLHLFEDRYRRLVADLLERPEPRGFGVVGIQLGHEVGEGAAHRLADVGCVAELREVAPHPDGRYDIVTVGTRRFRVKELDRSRPYLQGEVEFLPEEAGADPEPVAARVRRLFRLYRHRLGAAGAGPIEAAEPPDDPVALSHAIAAALVLDGHEKQRLLECEDAALRLAAERDLLHRENRILDILPMIPAGQFLDGAFTPN
ncbi:LON peptidase substrate-binding domain-containing protein [Actinomadura sp. NAK00032]|uniref:LON peptidase substrate-binding domain-containing protein n=1 Tax=Actinomadura sp. NAK00032 TaxID=2742128 RepID=UPI001590DB67|nr:LON peptidase substrate-binding domain-containing protein [Actinomadura sp. NAK00032]QKW35339.1 LON peptidase substrate-binding domain-containing protein [Actinomadura sp. NAK00032]